MITMGTMEARRKKTLLIRSVRGGRVQHIAKMDQLSSTGNMNTVEKKFPKGQRSLSERQQQLKRQAFHFYTCSHHVFYTRATDLFEQFQEMSSNKSHLSEGDR